MLAWASAQIHCQFHASESRVALPAQGNKQDVQADSDTVLIPSRGQGGGVKRCSILETLMWRGSNQLKKYSFIGERGQCVLDTPPKILFCDLCLDPGESKTCMCVSMRSTLSTSVVYDTSKTKKGVFTLFHRFLQWDCAHRWSSKFPWSVSEIRLQIDHRLPESQFSYQTTQGSLQSSGPTRLDRF